MRQYICGLKLAMLRLTNILLCIVNAFCNALRESLPQEFPVQQKVLETI